MDTDKKLPLTQNAFDKLKAELAHLEGEAREKIIKEIATARAHGDLSENAEYHSAKDQQGLQEGRVRQIRSMLENAEIIEARDDGVVNPGMVVTIQHEGEDPETYLLGLREEKGGEHEILTPESPIGQALLGHHEGETVLAKIRDRELKIKIVSVKTQ
ncbi:MAG: transcription elongation factor GreA [Actinomycetota bacterium]|jgi:transcription elongation factor GreA|nr:transcription elongation factor GreA [Actinomycetota bacterium]